MHQAGAALDMFRGAGGVSLARSLLPAPSSVRTADGCDQSSCSPWGGDAHPKPPAPPGPFLGMCCAPPSSPLDMGLCLREGCVRTWACGLRGLAAGWGNVQEAAGLESWGLRVAGWLGAASGAPGRGAGQSLQGLWVLGLRGGELGRGHLEMGAGRPDGGLCPQPSDSGTVGGAESAELGVWSPGWAGRGVAWRVGPGPRLGCVRGLPAPEGSTCSPGQHVGLRAAVFSGPVALEGNWR